MINNIIYQKELNEKMALEALGKILPNIKRMIDETEILVWYKLENTVSTYFDHEIWENISYKVNEITPKGARFTTGSYRLWNFPSLRLEYQKKDVPCLDWITNTHIIAEVTLSQYVFDTYTGKLFLAHYAGPEVTGIKPCSIFLTPLRLMECLTKGENESDDVERVGHHDNHTLYSVRGYPKEVILLDTFIDWVKRFSNGKGSMEFSTKMLNLEIMDFQTYDIVVSRIKSKIEPKILIPIPNVKDTERLRIIRQVKIMPSLGQWVKVIEKYGKRSKGIVFKSTQGFKDFLKRMEAGDYLKVHKEASGIRIELTEKGLRAIE